MTAAHSWHPVDLVAFGELPPEPPTIGGLLYPGRRHVISGELESLKSWLVQVLAVQEIRDGHTVIYIDYEQGPRDTLRRIRDLGLTDAEIARGFIYIEPRDGIGEHINDVIALLEKHAPTLVAIDAFTGALATHGLDPNKSTDIERFYTNVIDLFRAGGAAVSILDHLTKDRDTRGKYAIGSERKVAAADVHLSLETIQPFGRGRTGIARITTLKDRGAYLTRPRAGELELTSNPTTGQITTTLRAATPEDQDPADDPFRPTILMDRILEYLAAQTEPVSRKNVTDNIRGNRNWIIRAIDLLVTEQTITETRGPRGAKHLTSGPPIPPVSDLFSPIPKTTSNPPVPAPPLSGGPRQVQDKGHRDTSPSPFVDEDGDSLFGAQEAPEPRDGAAAPARNAAEAWIEGPGCLLDRDELMAELVVRFDLTAGEVAELVRLAGVS